VFRNDSSILRVKKNHAGIIILFLIVLTHAIYSSTNLKSSLQFQHFTSKDGLAQNSVTAILQDKKGFIWLGTQNGLNKFNGYDFQTFRVNINNSNSISSDFILCLYEDKEGLIWIGTNGGGLNRFNPSTGCFTNFLTNKKELDNPGNTINCIFEDSSGQLWIGTNGSGLKIFNRKTGLFQNFPIDIHLGKFSESLVINDILEDKNNTIWFATNIGIMQKISKDSKVKRFPIRTEGHIGLHHRKILSICKDRTETLWFGSDYGLFQLDSNTDTFIHRLIKNDGDSVQPINIIRVVFEDRFGMLWIGTEYGLHVLDKKRETFESFFTNRSDYFSLNGNFIEAIFEDLSGALWIGTDANGLDKINQTTRLFDRHYNNLKNLDRISNNSVFALYEDEANLLWIGTFGNGLNVYDPKTGNLKNYRNSPKDVKSISSNKIWAICEDNQKRVWIGTANNGISCFIRKTDNFIRYLYQPENPNSLSDNIVSSIIKDDSGTIWVATNKGINRFIPQINGFSHYNHQVGNKKSLIHNVVLVLFADSKGMIWAGTAGGICVLDPKNGIFTSYNIKAMIHRPVFSISQDQQGTMWIGSTGGLIQFNPKTQEHTVFRVKDGLPNNVINGILSDNSGNLWISTNLGLSKFNIETKKFKNYSQQDGLQSFEFNGGAYYKSAKGKLFFGGINGFNSFFPKNIKNNPYIPPVLISGLKVLGQNVKIGEKIKGGVVLNRSILDTDEITLNYKQHSFSIEFVALNYVNTKNNEYAYMMEGIEKNWNYIGQKRFVTYANLAPGHYVFHVKASNNNGTWNEMGDSLKIRIIPALQNTWWFQTLTLILIGFIVYVFIRQRNHSIKRRKLELENIVATRTAKLQESGKKYQTVVETSTQGIIIVKKDVIIFQNAQFSNMLGYSEKEIINNRLTKFIVSSELKEFKKFQKSLDSGKQKTGKFETVLQHKDDREINVEINYNTIEYKQHPALLMFFQNISIKKLIEEERLKIARLEASRNLANGISHDFNNLLTIIQGYLGLALNEVEKNNLMHSRLLKINEASQTAADLIQQFLFIANSGESEKLIKSIAPIIRKSTLEALQDSLIECHFDISANLDPINCNINDISQAIKNIVTNAIQSMGKKGKLKVKATNQRADTLQIHNTPFERYVCISFEDNGHGISKKDMPNIFDPYFSTRKNVTQKGLGLGLAVVNVILLQHKGFIRIESDLGKGTSISLFLPASQNTKD